MQPFVIMWDKIIQIWSQIKNWDFLNTDPSDRAELSDVLAFIFTFSETLLILALNLYLLHLQMRTGD